MYHGCGDNTDLMPNVTSAIRQLMFTWKLYFFALKSDVEIKMGFIENLRIYAQGLMLCLKKIRNVRWTSKYGLCCRLIILSAVSRRVSAEHLAAAAAAAPRPSKVATAAVPTLPTGPILCCRLWDAGEYHPCWTPWLLPLSPHTSGGKYFSEHLNIFQMNSFMLRDRENKVVCCPGETFSRQNIWCIKSVNVVLWNTLGAHFIFENILTPVNLASGDLAL